MQEVPLKSIKCGQSISKQTNCLLVLPRTDVPRLDFVYKDPKTSDVDFFKLQCEKITAIDLRVEAKFGSIDAMEGTLLVECSVMKTNSSPLETINNTPAQFPETFNNSSTAGSCLVQATFHVNQTGAVRDIIRKLRSIYSSSNVGESISDEPQTNPKHFKEGLPNWVHFIPHYLYSKRTRQWIQFLIYIYVVFSVTWALWQLYRNVDFIRESVRPLIDVLQYQWQLLEYVIELFNTIFEEYTVQWLCFIKPLYTVVSIMAAPLFQTVKQLGPVFQIVFRSVAYGCSVLWPVVKPIVSTGYQFVYFIRAILRALVPSMLRTYFGAIKSMLGVLWHSLGQAQLNPINAQMVVIRKTVLQSSKAVGLGMVRLVRKIYKIIWLRRSARVEKQE